jgi:hypothetical protein
MRVVIIGGVAVGMSAASQARRTRPDAEILVLEKTQDVSYGACGLPRKLLGCCMVGPVAAAHKIDTAAAAIRAGMSAEQIDDVDLAYAPPFGPYWSPLLIAASQLSKALD